MTGSLVTLGDVLDKVSNILAGVWTPIILATLGFSLLYMFVLRK